MLLNFRFFPFDKLISSVDPLEEQRSLSWFDLTDGWYWIDAGTTQLFRYTRAAHELMQGPQVREENGCYVDYYVDVFLGDLLEHLPTKLEPLPEALVERVSHFKKWQCWLRAWKQWMNAQDDQVEEEESVDRGVAVNWWYKRMLDVGYLTTGPNIWMWNDGISMHLAWDNRDCLYEGIPAWEAQMGEIQLSLKDFLAELQRMNSAFLETMHERILAAVHHKAAHWQIQDLHFLQEVQQQKAKRMEEALRESVEREPTNWEEVFSAISWFERDEVFLQIYQKMIEHEGI